VQNLSNLSCSFSMQAAPLILRDGNGAIYPLAKDCLDGIRDPLWFDLPPLLSLGMGVQSVPNASSTSKNRIAIISLALAVQLFNLCFVFDCLILSL
jgi:E3 ubiquitin-protein ligase EDD1